MLVLFKYHLFFLSCSLNAGFSIFTPLEDVTSSSLSFPILTALQTSMNALPSASI